MPAGSLHHGRGVVLQLRTEGVVGSQEIPALAAGLDHRVARALGQRHGVVGPVQGVGVALLVGERRCGRADGDEELFLLGCDLGHGQCGAGIGATDQHIDALRVEPLARLGGGHVGLVLVVGVEHLDLLAGNGAAHVGHRHADGFHPGRAVDVRVQARHVGDDADADDIARDLGLCRCDGRTHRGEGQAAGSGQLFEFHGLDLLGLRLGRCAACAHTPRYSCSFARRDGNSAWVNSWITSPCSTTRKRSASGAAKRKFCSTITMV